MNEFLIGGVFKALKERGKTTDVYFSENLFEYGYCKNLEGELAVLIGPARTLPVDEPTARAIAERSPAQKEQYIDVIKYISSLGLMQVKRFLHIMIVIHEALNGFADFENCNLGLVPAGTGNDFAAAAKIPADTDKALDLILHTSPKPTDFMQMEGVRGINVIGTGIDVEILKRCRASKWLRGKLQYVISLVISLFKYKNYKMRTVCNGTEKNYSALIACIGNGRQIGGGIRMCPEAVLDDGLLDFVVCNDVKKTHIPAAFIKLMKGKILQESFTDFTRCERVEVYPEQRLTVQVDGELYDDIPFKVEVVRNKLKMYRG